MRNSASWAETKFVTRDGSLGASARSRDLSVASRLNASLIADFYGSVLPRHARGHLADLGCGTVPLFGTYRDRVDQVTTVDWPGSVHRASHTDVFADLAAGLPFADGSFDTVLLSDVLEHLPHPEHALAEIFRVLRPGGTLLMNTPFLYPVHEAPHDFYRYTRYSLELLTTGAGFADVEVHELGDAFDVLADLASKVVLGIPVLGSLLARFLQGVMVGTRHARLRRVLRRRAGGYAPLGYGLVAVRPG